MSTKSVAQQRRTPIIFISTSRSNKLSLTVSEVSVWSYVNGKWCGDRDIGSSSTLSLTQPEEHALYITWRTLFAMVARYLHGCDALEQKLAGKSWRLKVHPNPLACGIWDEMRSGNIESTLWYLVVRSPIHV